jgi:hypothetical protein
VAPTAGQLEAASRARAQFASVMSRWTTLSTTELRALNAKRRAAGLPELSVDRFRD